MNLSLMEPELYLLKMKQKTVLFLGTALFQTLMSVLVFATVCSFVCRIEAHELFYNIYSIHFAVRRPNKKSFIESWLLTLNIKTRYLRFFIFGTNIHKYFNNFMPIFIVGHSWNEKLQVLISNYKCRKMLKLFLLSRQIQVVCLARNIHQCLILKLMILSAVNHATILIGLTSRPNKMVAHSFFSEECLFNFDTFFGSLCSIILQK